MEKNLDEGEWKLMRKEKKLLRIKGREKKQTKKINGIEKSPHPLIADGAFSPRAFKFIVSP
jgi:hypothetical protein